MGRKKTISDMNAVVHEDADKHKDLDDIRSSSRWPTPAKS
jgi:hypothetical protein